MINGAKIFAKTIPWVTWLSLKLLQWFRNSGWSNSVLSEPYWWSIKISFSKQILCCKHFPRYFWKWGQDWNWSIIVRVRLFSIFMQNSTQAMFWLSRIREVLTTILFMCVMTVGEANLFSFTSLLEIPSYSVDVFAFELFITSAVIWFETSRKYN